MLPAYITKLMPVMLMPGLGHHPADGVVAERTGEQRNWGNLLCKFLEGNNQNLSGIARQHGLRQTKEMRAPDAVV